MAKGSSVIDPKVVDALVAGPAGPLHTGQTDRPRTEVMAEMAAGKDNTAIAGALFLTVKAVEKHINGIFSKLELAEEREVHKRVKAVLLWLASAQE